MNQESQPFSTPTWRLFEDLVQKILEAHTFQVEVHALRGDSGFDFLGTRGAEQWAIEVKYYRTGRAQPTLIEAAAARLARNGVHAKALKGMLVVSCVLPKELRSAIEEKFGLTLVDRGDLRDWASTNPELAEKLEVLVETSPHASTALRAGDDPLGKDRLLRNAVPQAPSTRGSELCATLARLKKGRRAWKSYEGACVEILKFLFPNDLYGWHAQKRTDDGISRFDFVCRVRETTEFWKFVIEQLDSRYILFEFKNYSEKIKQGQILTTEKYLLERAHRKVAIILTRAGADENAHKMIQGAMREQGKLMLVLDDETLCDMLRRKDRGDDPTDRLFDRTDDFLMSLSR